MLKPHFSLPSFLLTCLLILTTPFCSIENKNNTPTNPKTQERKQRGAHLFGRADSLSFPPLIKNNMEWVTYVPWGDLDDYDSPSMGRGIPKDSVQLIRKDSSWQR